MSTYNKDNIITILINFRLPQGRPQDLGGGPKIVFFRFRNLHVAKRHAHC